ncbi:MAG: YjbQ family protein, partial [Solirubrobacterales bacterium]
MKSHTAYMTFNTDERREFVRITEDVERAVAESGVSEGMVLVSAMHITAGVWVNDDEPGIHADTLEWLDKVAPPSWREPSNEVARELLPEGGDYRHHR